MRRAALAFWMVLALGQASMPGPASVVAAGAEALRGDRFINVMKNNTLTGETAEAARFDLFFLPGGAVTYRDAAGDEDRGRWHVDQDGDICITWTSLDQGEQCFRVTLDGDSVSWEGKSGSGSGMLRGSITDGTLAPGSG